MNRIALGSASEISQKQNLQQPTEYYRVEQGIFSSETIGSSASCLFVPMHYEPKYAYPLLVWLHPNGESERQLHRIMELVSLRNYAAVSPRATHGCPCSKGRPVGFAWEQTRRGILGAWQGVVDCLRRADTRFHLAKQRIFIGGHREGATMAMRLAFANPGVFAGTFALGGPFPKDHQPLCKINSVRDLSVMVAFGRDSMHYCEDHVCRDLRLLHSTGVRLTARQYSHGDQLTSQMLSDVDRWMMRIVTGAPEEPEESTTYFGDTDGMFN